MSVDDDTCIMYLNTSTVVSILSNTCKSKISKNIDKYFVKTQEQVQITFKMYPSTGKYIEYTTLLIYSTSFAGEETFIFYESESDENIEECSSFKIKYA